MKQKRKLDKGCIILGLTRTELTMAVCTAVLITILAFIPLFVYTYGLMIGNKAAIAFMEKPIIWSLLLFGWMIGVIFGYMFLFKFFEIVRMERRMKIK